MGLFSELKRRYKSFRRYNKIIRVFVKYGFEDFVSYIIQNGSLRFLRRLIPRFTRNRASMHSKWEKMRLVCEELGPTFVKFGQILSNRADLIPAELVVEFEKLQDKVPPFSAKEAKQVVESELNKSIEVLFKVFEPEPFASASMAQVHKAYLKTGEKVAIKIQRPGIQDMITEDIKVMYTLAALFEKRIPSLRAIDPVELVKNFEISILKELDFIHESINVQRFHNNLTNEKVKGSGYCPAVYPEFSTGKVLTLEFINGTKISEYDKLLLLGHDRKIIAQKLSTSYVKQVFDYGFFHADLHPGNILIRPDGEICFLDFGLMGSIMPRDIEMIGKLFTSVLDKDVKNIIRALQQMSGELTINNMRDFEAEINEFVQVYSASSLHKNEMSTILMELRDIIIKNGLKVPAHFFLLARSMVTVEGVIHKLDPNIELLNLAKPYIRRIIRRKLNPLRWGKKVLSTLFEFGNQMEDFPRDLKNAIRRINTGQLNVNLNHKGIDPMVHTINRVTKQLISAVIVASMLVTSGLFITKGIGPKWQGYSVFGEIGIALALIIIFGMLRDIRKGDHDYDH